jgi:hypothetical protein
MKKAQRMPNVIFFVAKEIGFRGKEGSVIRRILLSVSPLKNIAALPIMTHGNIPIGNRIQVNTWNTTTATKASTLVLGIHNKNGMNKS